MAFPADLETIVVRHKITDAAGRPLKGNTVTAEPAERVWATDGSIVQYRATTQIDANGQWELELPYVDQEGIRNKGVPWRVTEHVPGQPKSYFVAPVLAHGAGPIDAAECLVSAPTSRETVIQAGPVTDEAAASLLAQDGEFKAALMDTIEQQVPAKVTEALAADDAPAQAAAAAVTTELVEGAAGRMFAPRAMAAAPLRRSPLPGPIEWITTFQAGHGWTDAFSGDGASTADPDLAVIGSQSMRLTSRSTGQTWAIQARNLDLDMTGKMFVVLFHLPEGQPVGWVNFQAGDNNHSASFRWDITDGRDGSRWVRNGEWVLASLPWPSTHVIGTPDRSNITGLRLVINGDGGPASVNFQAVGIVPDRTSERGIVSITFDDGYASDYHALRNVLAPRGLRGTSYIIPEQIDSNPDRFLTLAQVQEMAWTLGHDFQAHGLGNYVNKTPDELRTEWSALLDSFARWGLGRPEHIAYVGGQNNLTVTSVAREFFVSGRTIDGRLMNSFPPGDPYRLRAASSITDASGGRSIASTKTLIDHAVEHKAWLILTFHRIVDTPASSVEISWNGFTEVCDYIAASGAECLPVADVFHRYG